MCIKGSAVDLADADGNVGAVVGNPFEVGHHIGKDKTKLDRAFSTLEPFDVVVLQAGIQAVNHLCVENALNTHQCAGKQRC